MNIMSYASHEVLANPDQWVDMSLDEARDYLGNMATAANAVLSIDEQYADAYLTAHREEAVAGLIADKATRAAYKASAEGQEYAKQVAVSNAAWNKLFPISVEQVMADQINHIVEAEEAARRPITYGTGSTKSARKPRSQDAGEHAQTFAQRYVYVGTR